MFGPLDEVVTRPSVGERKYYRRKTWYRSGTKAWVKPLPYDMYVCNSTLGDAPNTWVAHQVASDYPPSGYVTNKAYDKFVESFKGGTDAAMAVTMAEWRQSASMIAHRATQILAFAKLVSSRKFRLGHEVSSRLRGRGRRRLSKDFSKRWLELHFGWVPLCQDIYNISQVMGGPLGRVSASGRAKEDIFHRGQGLTAFFDVGVSLKADVHLTNPNLALANRLGLINPATVAWELVPYSFAVDWFIPVGAFLNSFTDFVGYEMQNAQMTTIRRGRGGHPARPEVGMGDACHVVRELRFPGRSLHLNHFPSGLSLSRGATAVALLTKFLRNHG